MNVTLIFKTLLFHLLSQVACSSMESINHVFPLHFSSALAACFCPCIWYSDFWVFLCLSSCTLDLQVLLCLAYHCIIVCLSSHFFGGLFVFCLFHSPLQPQKIPLHSKCSSQASGEIQFLDQWKVNHSPHNLQMYTFWDT